VPYPWQYPSTIEVSGITFEDIALEMVKIAAAVFTLVKFVAYEGVE